MPGTVLGHISCVQHLLAESVPLNTVSGISLKIREIECLILGSLYNLPLGRPSLLFTVRNLFASMGRP